MEERMALAEKFFPELVTFILLIIMALALAPTRNARREAIRALGVEEKTVAKASSPSQKGAPGSSITSCAASTKSRLSRKPIQMVSLALR